MAESRVATFVFLILALPGVASCQATHAVIATFAGGVACSSSESGQNFPPEGSVRDIAVQFVLLDESETIQFRNVGRCEYQGSICFAGQWSDVWYAPDRSERFEWSLGNGNSLSYMPHSMCIRLSDYTRSCEAGDCNANSHFARFVLKFSDENANALQDRIRLAHQAEFPNATTYIPPDVILDRVLVTPANASDFEVNFGEINISVSETYRGMSDAPNNALERPDEH